MDSDFTARQDSLGVSVESLSNCFMLPAKVRVKLLPEAAGYVTVSHVMQRDFSIGELLQIVLPVVGRDADRLRQILRAGNVVAGQYRYRWEPLEVAEPELQSALVALPGPEPSRPFQSENCYRLRFHGGQGVIEISREAAARKPLFAKQSFWDALLSSFGEAPRYEDYNYAERADVYTSPLSQADRSVVEALLPLLKPKELAQRLRAIQPESLDWFVRR